MRRSSRRWGIGGLFAVVCACAQPAPQVPTPPEPGAPASVPDAEASARAGDEIRDLLLAERVEAARARVGVYVQQFPDDARLRWLAGAAAIADNDAQALAAQRAALAEDSGWALLLRVQAERDKLPREETTALALKARALLDDHADAVWSHAVALRAQSDEAGLGALAELPGLADSVRDFVYGNLIDLALFRFSAAPPPTRPSLEEVQALVARAEQAVPAGTLAVSRAAAGFLDLQKVELAQELITRALGRHPDDLGLLVLQARVRVAAGKGDEARRAAVAGELMALAARHGDDPEALAQIEAGLSRIGASEAAQSIQADIRARFPAARAVEVWDWRATSVFGAVGTCRMALGIGELPPADELAEQRAPVDAFFDRPQIRDAKLRASTAAALVEFFQCDPQAPLERVEAVARTVLETPYGAMYDAPAAVLVATRGGDLELARALAERAVARGHELPGGFVLVAEPTMIEEYRRAMRGIAHHARGVVHLRAGRIEEARADLTRAHELQPTQPDIALAAAELAERDGDVQRAERILARAIAQAGARARACREKLAALLRARGQRTAELDRMVARLEREWQDEHIAEVLAARAVPPRPLAPFDLELRGGGRIASTSLGARVTVVIATEPWCTGCRLEAPELAKLQQRYRGRKDVQFLVVSSDPDGIAALHEGQGFVSPIAKDNGWRHEVGINAYPTHLFLDAEGREVYRGIVPHAEMHFVHAALIEAIRRK